MTDPQQALEFDCGPGVRLPDTGRSELDQFLRRPREEPKLELVLVSHLPVESKRLCEKKLDWERKMRAAGVRFGSHELIHHGLLNVVVKYEERNDSFAWQAGAAAEWPPVVKRRHSDAEGATAKAEESGCVTLAKLQEKTVNREQLRPLNFLGSVGGVRSCRVEQRSSIAECAAYYRRGFTIVFVGADYDSIDRFVTPVGEKPGVTLHAYAAYSMKHEHELTVKHWLTASIEAFFGFVVGVGLHAVWKRYWSASGAAGRLGWAVGSFAILLVVSALAVLGAPWLMAAGQWINPGPMLVGLFVDSWHTSVTGRHDGPITAMPAGQATAMSTPRLADRVVEILRCVVWAGVVIGALFLAVSELLNGGSH